MAKILMRHNILTGQRMFKNMFFQENQGIVNLGHKHFFFKLGVLCKILKQRYAASVKLFVVQVIPSWPST